MEAVAQQPNRLLISQAVTALSSAETAFIPNILVAPQDLQQLPGQIAAVQEQLAQFTRDVHQMVPLTEAFNHLMSCSICLQNH